MVTVGSVHSLEVSKDTIFLTNMCEIEVNQQSLGNGVARQPNESLMTRFTLRKWRIKHGDWCKDHVAIKIEGGWQIQITNVRSRTFPQSEQRDNLTNMCEIEVNLQVANQMENQINL